MGRLKKTIKEFIPPALLSFYIFLKNGFKKKKRVYQFSGVFNNINEVRDENPWIQEPWIELSKTKLRRATEMYKDEFSINGYFSEYSQLFCLIINLVSHRNKCNILDLGGGTGLIYFIIAPYFANPKNVFYHVVDGNQELFKLGKEHAKKQKMKNRIIYHPKMPNKSSLEVDILYINTSLQYIYNYVSLLEEMLVQYKPQYVVLTRLMSGNVKTYITSQNILGYNTPAIFIDYDEIVNVFLKNNFDLIFKSPCSPSFDKHYNNDIPTNLRIPNTLNLVFKRKIN